MIFGHTVVSALRELSGAVRANTLAVSQLTYQEREVMATAAEAVAAVNQLVTDVTAVVDASNKLIAALKAQPAGALDQATLDQLVAGVQGANQKLEAETTAEQQAVAPPAPPPAP